MDERERSRSLSFGEDAAAYDRARPSYPAELVDWLLERAPGRRVLDVGCGTGKLGRLFLERGCDVLGVEPDRRMAEVARAHGLEVEVAAFEPWDDRGRRFDLVVSGTAWHWVDPHAGGAKAASVLVPGGRFAAAWNMGDHEPSMHARLEEVYADFPEVGFVHPFTGGERNPLVGLDAFGCQDIVSFRWKAVHSTAEWLDLLPTHSDHRAMAPDRGATLLQRVATAIDAEGGTLTITYETVCWTALRR